MSRRRKIFGFTEPDGVGGVRLFVGDDECWADLLPGVLPDGLPEGTPFTLHFRGAKFLYAYVIDKPLRTRSQVKRARIKAREWVKIFKELDAYAE